MKIHAEQVPHRIRIFDAREAAAHHVAAIITIAVGRDLAAIDLFVRNVFINPSQDSIPLRIGWLRLFFRRHLLIAKPRRDVVPVFDIQGCFRRILEHRQVEASFVLVGVMATDAVFCDYRAHVELKRIHLS